MKTATKENLLEAIDKVEEQGRVVQCGYIDKDKSCRCVIGHLLSNEELEQVIEEDLNNTSIGGIGFAKWEDLERLANLQNINDRINNLDEFVDIARRYIHAIFN